METKQRRPTGRPKKSTVNVKTGIYVPDGLLAWFDKQAEREQRSRNALITRAMERERDRLEDGVQEAAPQFVAC